MVAIIDHEHFRMKLLYQQKKQISIQVKEVKKEVKLYEVRHDVVHLGYDI